MHVTRRSIILGIGRRRRKNEQKTILIIFFVCRFHGIGAKRNYTKRTDSCSKPKVADRLCTYDKSNPRTLETIHVERKITWVKQEHLLNFRVS